MPRNWRVQQQAPVTVLANGEVRFGSTVTFVHDDGPQQGTERRITIVGVDEASVKEQRIAFTAPIARAVIGKRIGEVAEFRLGPAVLNLSIKQIQ